MALEVGSLLGGCYRIEGALGEGGMASVYRAVHVITGQHVAAKVLRAPEAPAQRSEILHLFEQEFTTLAQVSHPRVVAGYDYGIDPHAGPFYVMELLDGGDLHQRAPMPWRELCAAARDVCAALALLHSRRLVYRDLSPKNVR
ncbi:MAG TPA: protein kinase, partial [Polyangiales bacterium]